MKVPGRVRATGSEGLGVPTHDIPTPSSSLKRSHVEGRSAIKEVGNVGVLIPNSLKILEVALPLVGSSTRPLLTLSLVSSNDLDRLLKMLVDI